MFPLFVVGWSLAFIFLALPSPEVLLHEKVMGLLVGAFVAGGPWACRYRVRKDVEVLGTSISQAPRTRGPHATGAGILGQGIRGTETNGREGR